MSAVKRLIEINCIQNKSYCSHNICVSTVYIYYVYINTHTHACIYLRKIYYVYIINIFIYYKLCKYIHVNNFKTYTVCVCIYVYIINICSTHTYIM